MGLISQLKDAREELRSASKAMMTMGAVGIGAGIFPVVAGIAAQGSKPMRAAAIIGGGTLTALGILTVVTWAKVMSAVSEQ